MYVQYTKIKLTFKKVLTGILFGLALLMAAVRMVIQIHSYGKLHPDDFLLLFACLTFIASQTLLYTLQMKILYWLLEVGSNATNREAVALVIGDRGAAYSRRFLKVQRTDASSTSLTWASIFAVKICFLLFFYPLITRFRKWVLAWKVIFGITILAGALCISSSFIACPYFGPTACKLALPSHRIQLLINYSQYLTKNSKVFARSRSYESTFYGHLSSYSRYHVGPAP